MRVAHAPPLRRAQVHVPVAHGAAQRHGHLRRCA